MASTTIQFRCDWPKDAEEFHHFFQADHDADMGRPADSERAAQRFAYLTVDWPSEVSVTAAGPAADILAWVDRLHAYAHQHLDPRPCLHGGYHQAGHCPEHNAMAEPVDLANLPEGVGMTADDPTPTRLYGPDADPDKATRPTPAVPFLLTLGDRTTAEIKDHWPQAKLPKLKRDRDGLKWAWRSVNPDFTSSNGFRWPFPGHWAEAPGPFLDHRQACPTAVGDGICLAWTIRGATSSGMKLGVGLVCGYQPADLLGCNDADTTTKLRVKRAWVGEAIGTIAELTLRDADLGGADLRDADLGGADLGGANLRDANLRGANLGYANLGYANLGDANLGDADLGGADLGGANLGGANLGDANLRGANLGYANLGGADLGYANLRDANLRDANLGYANLGYANLRGADLGGADLRGADLGGADLRDADLGGANLGDANLRDANLRDANLGYANLGYANLGYANLGYANNGDANNVSYSYLAGARYSQLTLWPIGFDPKAAGAVCD